MKAAVVVLLVASLAAVAATPAFTDSSPIQFYAWLSYATTTATAPTAARGACAGRIDAAFNFELICHHNISNYNDPVTAAHIHGPVANPATATGDVLVALVTTGELGTVSFSGILTQPQYCAIFATQTYVNVHTASSGNGLIRGVLTPVGGASGPTHAATLNNAQVVPAIPALGNWGVALITRNGANLWTSIFHNLTATAEHYHLGAIGLSGSPIYFICSPPTYATCVGAGWNVNEAIAEASSTTAPVYGPSTTDAGGLYINVHTNAYGNGQIRGQVQKVVAATAPASCTASSTGSSDAFAVKASFGVVALLAVAAALLQ